MELPPVGAEEAAVDAEELLRGPPPCIVEESGILLEAIAVWVEDPCDVGADVDTVPPIGPAAPALEA
jgi:hypothetical protein